MKDLVQLAPVIGSICVGMCVWLLAQFVVTIVNADRRDATLNYVELRRHKQLRATSFIFRNFEPAVERLAQSSFLAPNSASQKEKSASFAHAIQTLPNYPPWRLDEFTAASLIAGLGLGVVTAAFATAILGWYIGAIVLFVLPIVYARINTSSIQDRAKQRAAQIKRRLPFAVDLMALVMESGASFQQALRTVVAESQDHPLGEDLSKVLLRIDRGEVQASAMEEFQQRIGDEDLRQLVDAINQGDKLGTPLAQILRKQSDVIQIKTSQWVERVAKEAEVKMTGPGFVMAMACMVIIAAPFVLKAIDFF